VKVCWGKVAVCVSIKISELTLPEMDSDVTVAVAFNDQPSIAYAKLG
jgi:hypothetical protein